MAEYPDVYAYTSMPDAAGLLACFGVGGTIVGVVDTDRRIATFSAGPGEDAAVVWTVDVLFIRAATVLADPPSEWLSIQREDTSTATAKAIEAALDNSLAGAAFAPSLPASATDVLAAVRAVHAELSTSTDQDGRRVVRAAVDAARLEQSARTDEDRTGDTGLVIEFTISATGRVDQIRSNTLAQDGTDDPDAFGLTTTFDWTATSTELSEPSDDTVTPSNEIADSSITREPGERCGVAA